MISVFFLSATEIKFRIEVRPWHLSISLDHSLQFQKKNWGIKNWHKKVVPMTISCHSVMELVNTIFLGTLKKAFIVMLSFFF